MSDALVKEPINFGGLLFSKKGRIGRGPFWLGWALLKLVGFALLILWSMFFVAGATTFLIVFTASLLVYIWLEASAYIKRLHDLGAGGWWYVVRVVLALLSTALFFYVFRELYPIILEVAQTNNTEEMEIKMEEWAVTMEDNPLPVLAWCLTSFVSFIWGLILWLVCGIGGGNREDNKYGADPRTYAS